MTSLPTAYIRYDHIVMWKKPGGHHHVKLLKKGEEVSILGGWRYSERTWKDKRYVKAMAGCSIGYVLASSLSDSEVKIDPPVIEDDEEKPEELINDEYTMDRS